MAGATKSSTCPRVMTESLTTARTPSANSACSGRLKQNVVNKTGMKWTNFTEFSGILTAATDGSSTLTAHRLTRFSQCINAAKITVTPSSMMTACFRIKFCLRRRRVFRPGHDDLFGTESPHLNFKNLYSRNFRQPVFQFSQFNGFYVISACRTGVCRTRLNSKINGRQHSTISPNTRNVSTNAHKCAC